MAALWKFAARRGLVTLQTVAVLRRTLYPLEIFFTCRGLEMILDHTRLDLGRRLLP